MQISREELYKQIWAEPATKVAKRFDVSSSYLARVCEGLNVPHPPRGYWARKAAGEKMKVPRLPPAAAGDPVEWVKGVAVAERMPLVVPVPPAKDARLPEAQRPARHPLVTLWADVVKDVEPDDAGYMKPRKKNLLDVLVTRKLLKSTVQSLNAILIELEMRGHRVLLSSEHRHRPAVDIAQRAITTNRYSATANLWDPARQTVTYIDGVAIGLTVFELTEYMRVRRTASDRYVPIKELNPLRRYAPQDPFETDLQRDMPTGRLVLRAYSPVYDTAWCHEWTESNNGDFASMASQIADHLEMAAPVVAAQAEEADKREEQRRAEADKEWRRYQKERRIEEHRKAVQEARGQLLAIVDAWNQAFALDAFFRELDRRMASLEGAQRDALQARVAAARALMGGADAIDRFLRWSPPTEATGTDTV